MKGIGIIVIALLVHQFTYAMDADCSDETESTTTLYHCGEGSEIGFNGWSINGISNSVNVYFENNHIEFFSHQPGNYAIELTKRIEDMVGFNKLNISVDLEEIANCNLHDATAYISTDGRSWKGINQDLKNGTAIASVEKMNCTYIKIIANISFYNQGRFRFNRALVQGAYNVKPMPASFVSEIKKGPAAVQVKQMFLVFNFEKNINIETQNEKDYEFVLTNLAGQVVQKEQAIGSNRFETAVPNGIYFVSIVQDNKLIITKKVVL